MMTTIRTCVLHDDSTSISITELVPAEARKRLWTKIELGNSPSWLSTRPVTDTCSIEQYLKERRDVAGLGSASISFEAPNIDDVPTEFQNAVSTVERGDIEIEDVPIPDDFEFPPRSAASLCFSGNISCDGTLNNMSVTLYYEKGIDLEHVRTFEDGDTVGEGLKLPHNEVVLNADENMDWVRKSDMLEAERLGEQNLSWKKFLWMAEVDGQVTDGAFENSSPPFDYTELLEFDGQVGRMMYYAYRYHGWDYDVERLEQNLESFTETYPDGWGPL